ncbi:capsular polysaccharide export protein, LipB/KpsS family [Paracoccus salsus]|uniref:capsular polysaccharide export protein, LipB/KpsS family n=1 Tax=Paracoccus salsus TaxID=2911061 RepID=UPI001F27D2BA|nr:hypothetical protein [Paracoccus salsus]MCF3974418.1 hypothetical protein [Paracoccus salsus]
MTEAGDGRRIVTLEVPEAWFRDPDDGERHRLFYSSLLAALADLDVLLDPVWLPRGAERAPRPDGAGDVTISFHSYGAGGDILRCKEGYIPPFYTMDGMGYACFSELASHPDRHADAISRQDPDRAAAFVQALAQDLRQGNRSKYRQPDHRDHAQTGYLFVPLQVENDSVAQGLWLDTRRAMHCLVEAAAARGLPVILKRHPRCKSRSVSRMLAELARRPGVSVSTGSVHSLIADARLVVGANSGVLFEALIQGKPVISYAASDFGPATQQVRSYAALAEAIAAPALPDARFRDRFLFWYLTEYCVRADDVAAIRRRIGAVLDGSAPAQGSGRNRAYRLRLYAYSLADRLRKRLF